jgi:hypothetical protein
VGCADCDPRSYARDFAGDGAIDCGFAPVDTDPAAVDACMRDAAMRGVPFFGGTAASGIDSVLTVYAASDGENGIALSHDSLGGRLTAFPCSGPFERVTFDPLPPGGATRDTVTCNTDPSRMVELCR